MREYKGVMDKADWAAVYYSKHALELKRMPELPKEVVAGGFAKKGIAVINERPALEDWLFSNNYSNAVVVFMSSGNYDGFDTAAFAEQIAGSAE
jgi:UDP-N-acetylmuramate: L-alanyl-gamma-D-glutamyl-meso-diaminopimelate ligase